jgi:predicted ATPase/DNA-binding winged helix-turn-helix (wHTH) protein
MKSPVSPDHTLPDLMASERNSSYVFGSFHFDPFRKVLLKDGVEVPLGSRALLILRLLVRNAGEIVRKEDLLREAWPDTFVEEGNLRIQILALRKALADAAPGGPVIRNVMGRGYAFLAPVEIVPALDKRALASPAPAARPLTRHLAQVGRIVGRAEIIKNIAGRLAAYRLVTIVGPGGVGKTTVAIAVAHRTEADFAEGWRFVDLAALTNPRDLPEAVFSAVVASGSAHYELAAALAGRSLLIILDNCEHLLDAAAELAEEISACAPDVRVIATSREPLRAQGEAIFRLASLDVPPRGRPLSIAELRAHAAAELFLDRLGAQIDPMALTPSDIRLIAEISRKLDGIPLAIELAAAQVEYIGLQGLASSLDSSFLLAAAGAHRTLPRQQTLRAVLEWSYRLLTADAQDTLRQISIFRGEFTLASARSVITPQAEDPGTFLKALVDLAKKSLVNIVHQDGDASFRLLDTTRQFAAEKLAEAGMYGAVALRHAHHVLVELQQTTVASAADRAAWTLERSHLVEDLRAALDWAFSDEGDEEIGVALSMAAAPIWMTSILSEDAERQLETALSNAQPHTAFDVQRRFHLFATLASRLLFFRTGGAEVSEAWRNSFDVTKGLGETEFRLWTFWGSWLNNFMVGRHRGALAFAQKCYTLASRAQSAEEVAIAQLMIAISLFALGYPVRSAQHTEPLLDPDSFPVSRSMFVRFQWDPRVAARSYHAESLWLQGRTHEALRLAKENLQLAQGIGHQPSVWNALAHCACPVAIRGGRHDLAEAYVADLRTVSKGNALWSAWADAYEGSLLVSLGEGGRGAAILSDALSRFPENAFGHRLLGFVARIAEGQILAGDHISAAATVERALGRARDREDFWCLPEILRLKAKTILCAGGSSAKRDAKIHLRLARRFSHSRRMAAWQERIEADLRGR